MIGRGTLKYPGSQQLLILDVVGATARHDLVAVVDLGLTTGSSNQSGRPVPKSIGGMRAVMDPCELCGRQLPKATLDAGKTRHFNCRAGASARVNLFAASRMTWLEVDGGYTLTADKGAMVIIPSPGDDDLWHLIHYGNAKITVLQRSVPLDWCQGIAEDRARAFGKLTAQSASWRRRAPTPRQLSRLVREGFPEAKLNKIKTQGDAADLMTRLTGRRAIRLLERRAELRATKEMQQ